MFLHIVKDTKINVNHAKKVGKNIQKQLLRLVVY